MNGGLCVGAASNFISDISGAEYTETVCGHPDFDHKGGYGPCFAIIGDGCDVGDEHGARYCNCAGFVSAPSGQLPQ